MLSGIPSASGGVQTDFGEQMLNRVARESMRRMFSHSEVLDVNIRCFPSSKLLQGSVDSVKIEGRHLVIRNQFQVEEMSFETDAIALDFGSVLRGQLQLKQPTQAVAKVVLSESGINHAFQAELVQRHLQEVTLSGFTTPVSFQDITLQLCPGNQVDLQGKVKIPDQEPIPLAVRTTLSVERRRRLLFNAPQFQPQHIPESVRSQSETLTAEFVAVLNTMVDLDRFDLNGIEMRINRIETQAQQLLLSGYAQIQPRLY